jgi:hypothetical protein
MDIRDPELKWVLLGNRDVFYAYLVHVRRSEGFACWLEAMVGTDLLAPPEASGGAKRGLLTIRRN